MSIFVSELDLKTRAPSAGKWNKVFESLEDLNNRTNKSFILLKRSSTDSISFPISGFGDATAFTTVVLDPLGVWDSGISRIVLPDWAIVRNITFNIDFTAYHTIPMSVRFSDGWSEVYDPATTASDGFKSMNVETGWQIITEEPNTRVFFPQIGFSGRAGLGPITLDNSESTWFYCEFRG